jgi:hypothetical protein
VFWNGSGSSSGTANTTFPDGIVAAVTGPAAPPTPTRPMMATSTTVSQAPTTSFSGATLPVTEGLAEKARLAVSPDAVVTNAMRRQVAIGRSDYDTIDLTQPNQQFTITLYRQFAESEFVDQPTMVSSVGKAWVGGLNGLIGSAKPTASTCGSNAAGRSLNGWSWKGSGLKMVRRTCLNRSEGVVHSPALGLVSRTSPTLLQRSASSSERARVLLDLSRNEHRPIRSVIRGKSPIPHILVTATGGAPGTASRPSIRHRTGSVVPDFVVTTGARSLSIRISQDTSRGTNLRGPLAMM